MLPDSAKGIPAPRFLSNRGNYDSLILGPALSVKLVTGIRSSLSDKTFGITATRPVKTESNGIPNPALDIGIGEVGYVRQTKSARAVCAWMVV
jgi:hypothetical protein